MYDTDNSTLSVAALGSTAVAAPRRNRRPAIVSAIAAINFAIALYLALAFVLLVVTSDYGESPFTWELWLVAGHAVINVVIGVGLWTLKNWARFAAVLLYLVSIGLELFAAAAGGPELATVVQVAISVAFIVILTRPNVAAAFR